MGTIIDYLNRLAGYDLWIVAVELLLIGLVVYWAVDFLEGTRGERLFRGVIFILIAGVLILNLVVGRLDFFRLQYLYKGFLLAILIIAVAAFQPEIRRALIRIGQPRFLLRRSYVAGVVEEIVNAVIELSTKRIGAIIVIERKVALGEFIETGVKVDARATAELLKTIFNPGSPLHDMAVIIRGDRIAAARVQLPLAEPSQPHHFARLSGAGRSPQGQNQHGIFAGQPMAELGSRHRAAAGITEASDAACIVVSEETSIVSIAEGGKLTRNIGEVQLRKHLTDVMDELATPAFGSHIVALLAAVVEKSRRWKKEKNIG